MYRIVLTEDSRFSLELLFWQNFHRLQKGIQRKECQLFFSLFWQNIRQEVQFLFNSFFWVKKWDWVFCWEKMLKISWKNSRSQKYTSKKLCKNSFNFYKVIWHERKTTTVSILEKYSESQSLWSLWGQNRSSNIYLMITITDEIYFLIFGKFEIWLQ